MLVLPRTLRTLAVATSIMCLFGGCASSNHEVFGPKPTSETTKPAPTPAAKFTQHGGCGDAFFWAATANATVAVTITVEARDRSAAKPTIINFELPDPKVQVEVQRGHSLLQPFCNDVINSDWKVESHQRATGGSGRIVLGPRGAAFRCGVRGELHLSSLTFADGSRLGPIDVTTRSIGCYAG